MYPCRRVEVCGDETPPHFVQETYCERGIDGGKLDGAVEVETTRVVLFTFMSGCIRFSRFKLVIAVSYNNKE